MEKAGDYSQNWLTLEQDSSTTKCTFYGHDKLPNGRPVYYSAEAENLRITHNSIRFDLTSYTLSYKPNGESLGPIESFKISNTLYKIGLGQALRGTISGDSIEFDRVSRFGQNNFNIIRLVKTANKNQKRAINIRYCTRASWVYEPRLFSWQEPAITKKHRYPYKKAIHSLPLA